MALENADKGKAAHAKTIEAAQLTAEASTSQDEVDAS